MFHGVNFQLSKSLLSQFTKIRENRESFLTVKLLSFTVLRTWPTFKIKKKKRRKAGCCEKARGSQNMIAIGEIVSLEEFQGIGINLNLAPITIAIF